MKTLEVTQGTPEWIEARAKRFCASEAPAMMGVSKYMTRTDLLRQKALGTAEDIDANQQALFDRGHAAEAAARPLVEAQIVDELFPATATDDSGRLLASFDGITMDGTTGYEHKLWNEEVAAMVRAGELSPMYYWQLEQQILVGGLERVIFVCSDGTPDRFVSMEYRAVPGRAEQLLAGWKQFEADLANYQPVEVLPPVMATPIRDLPALAIRVDGSLTITDNLSKFGAELNAFIANLNKEPTDDQAFADAENACKALSRAEEALKSAKESALAQTTSISELCTTIDSYQALARTNRLLMEKIVAAQKIAVRDNILKGGKEALAKHIEELNTTLGKPYMPVVPADFAAAMKGKRTIASLRNAVDTTLSQAKIAANTIGRKILANLTTLRTDAKDYAFLFSDTPQIVLKEPDDFNSLVTARILAHKQEQEKKEAEARERIRLEEEAKLRADAEAKARIEAEAKARVEAEIKAKAEAEERQRREIEEAKRKADAQREADLKAKEEATRTKLEPMELNKVATVGGSQPVDASKSKPDDADVHAEGKPIPAARSATLSLVSGVDRPTDKDIIRTLARSYGKPLDVIVSWLSDMDLEAARLATETQAA